MNRAKEEVFELSHGDVVAWVEPGSAVHLKCVTPHGDPVELNAAEVHALCDTLMRLAHETE
jgi:hypothetical protein